MTAKCTCCLANVSLLIDSDNSVHLDTVQLILRVVKLRPYDDLKAKNCY